MTKQITTPTGRKYRLDRIVSLRSSLKNPDIDLEVWRWAVFPVDADGNDLPTDRDPIHYENTFATRKAAEAYLMRER